MDATANATMLFNDLIDMLKSKGYHVGKDPHQFAYVKAIFDGIMLAVGGKGRKMQEDEGSSNSIFNNAPAGTGKTSLATLIGAWAVDKGLMKKIMYFRTEIDVGGKDRGALPGDDDDKNMPYKAPFIETLDEYQAGLYEKWSGALEEQEQIKKTGKANKIAIQRKAKAIATHPGHVRGKTREGMFIIIDEAQNWTKAQLQAVYTRFKNNCVIITTGHSGQIDISEKHQERVAGFLPFEVFAIHHKKKGAWVGTLVINYRGPFAQWSDEVDQTYKELRAAKEAPVDPFKNYTPPPVQFAAA